MPKEYVFEYPGTKQDFLKGLDPFPGHCYYSGNYLYLDEYIVAFVDESIHFGVARGGHSGGYWFIPVITEYDDHLELRGRIEYIGPGKKQAPLLEIIDNVGLFLLSILILPIILIFKLYCFIDWIIRKLINRPKPKEKTPEDGLFDLMENYIGCSRR